MKSRLKSPSSIMNKMQKRGLSLDFPTMQANIMDIAGVHYLAAVEYAETEEEAENAQLVILSVGEDDEGEYLDVVDDDELLLELGKLFEERLSDEYDIEE